MRLKVMYEKVSPDNDTGEPDERGIESSVNFAIHDESYWLMFINMVMQYARFDSFSYRFTDSGKYKQLILYCADSVVDMHDGTDTWYSLAITGTEAQIDRLMAGLRAKNAL